MDVDSADLKSDTFSLDLVELDDEEYNIPQLEETPTLESILNEDETSLLSEDELALLIPQQPRNNFNGSEDNLSIGSFGLFHGNKNSSPSSFQYKYDPGHILRHTTLKALSSQLRSASERVNIGAPSVMCVSTVIGVGTAFGTILVFDAMQTLRWRHEAGIEHSAVSALSFNHDCGRLLAGYACGTVLMFDVVDGRVLRTMNDVHTPFTAVLHVKFTDVPTLALCSDSGGNVFELNFKRTLGVRGVNSRCIFSGSRGEVCTVEPLLLYHLNSHPLSGHILVAMATLTKLIVVTIRPTMKVMMTHHVKADPLSLPFLSWQFVVIQLGENSRIMDPVLAFARDNKIYFYQVSLKSQKVRCTVLQQVSLDYSILTSHWLNSRTVAVLDTKEQLHLLDVRTRQELERLDLSGIGLLYNSSHFKGLSTGGNVSKAMALAGERACYNTVQGYGNQVLFLCAKSCHVVSIRSWIERLDSLVDKGRFEDALRLGIEFLEERGKIVLGLRGPHHQRYGLVKTKITEILITYIDLVLSGGATTAPINISINTIINKAALLDEKQLLFERMWEGFEYNGDSVCQDLFLRGLSLAIIDRKICEVPPAIMQQLVNHLSDLRLWKELEFCILNVNIECLDIQQALQCCRKYSLHSALISIWNRGMLDYVSPLYELLPKLKSSMEKDDFNYSRDLGNKLLVYISCCFSGHAYPHGNIDETRIDIVRNQVFQLLCQQHSVNADDDEDVYPYLRILLRFDTKEFLNVLAMAFNDYMFSALIKQRIFDILLHVIFSGSMFKPHEIGWVFTFLCKHSSGTERSRAVNIDSAKYDEVLMMLVNKSDVSSHEERQQSFLELMLADNFQHYQQEQLLTLARNAEFYLVCSEIHRRAGEHSQVLRCYLLDNARKKEVFDYLEQTQHKLELKQSIMDNIECLLEINGERTGELFGKHFPELLQNVIRITSRKQLYLFLKGAINFIDLDSSDVTLYMQLQCENCDEARVFKFVQKHKNLQLEKALQASRDYKMDRVTALLLERQGDYQSAFDVLFDRLKNSIEINAKVEDATEELVSLAHRGRGILEARTTWLPLLQCLLNLNSKDLLRRVLGSADLNLATELHLLLQHSLGTLGDFRNLITGLFEKCSYEYSMSKSVTKVVYSDLHEQLAAVIADANRGISGPELCESCQQSFKSQLLLFRCGHGYHEDCVENNCCTLCSTF